jgi:hypothetical protein
MIEPGHGLKVFLVQEAQKQPQLRERIKVWMKDGATRPPPQYAPFSIRFRVTGICFIFLLAV